MLLDFIDHGVDVRILPNNIIILKLKPCQKVTYVYSVRGKIIQEKS